MRLDDGSSLSWEDQLDDLLKKAGAQMSAGDHKGAAATLDRAPDVIKAFGTWRYARGNAAFHLGDIKTAVKELETAVQREPAIPEFRSSLAAALMEKARKGDHFALKRATELLEQAVREDPKIPDVVSNLGNAKLAANDAEGALSCFDRALAMDPNHIPSLYNRGAALKRLGRPKDALAMIDKILKLDPKFQPAIDAKKSLSAG